MKTPEDIEEAMLQVLQVFENRLPPDRYRDMLNLITHSECGIALEHLCQNLFDFEAPIKPGELAEIKKITSEMLLPESTWSFLASQ
jgi:hypothetical protein